MDTKVKLIVGLGNPGIRYEQTKHNVGFRVIETLQTRLSAGKLPRNLICKSLVMQATWHDLPIILAKPMTYMNNSGVAVAALIRQFEIPLSELCIIYDDIHLDLGVLRMRQKGSDGGQKGMKSIIQHLGTTAFPRLRIGIGEPIGDLTDYVLTDFTEDEEIEIAHTVDRAVGALETFVKDDILTAMNQFNRRC
jgi:PTH1 family peptidyl-tRNA hydrolase